MPNHQVWIDESTPDEANPPEHSSWVAEFGNTTNQEVDEIENDLDRIYIELFGVHATLVWIEGGSGCEDTELLRLAVDAERCLSGIIRRLEAMYPNK